MKASRAALADLQALNESLVGLGEGEPKLPDVWTLLAALKKTIELVRDLQQRVRILEGRHQ